MGRPAAAGARRAAPLLAALVGVLSLLAAPRPARAGASTLDITIPDSIKVEGEDAYICTTLQLPEKAYKLVGVEPLARQEVVHHILIFGCDTPYAVPKPGEQTVWDCKTSPTCGGNSETIMYGWGRNAPQLKLPPGVGFSMGKGSAVKWVVVQVHYLKEKPAGDVSGVRLKLQDDPVPYSAGLLSYASWFTIPPHKQHHLVTNNCCYRGFQPLTTFAVRVHTHTLGRRVFMTRAPPTDAGPGDVIATGDPLQPQGFSPVSRKVLWPGERMTVGCDFDSTSVSHAVSAGPTHTHEMCNMYLMVYSYLPHIEMCSDGSSLVDEYSPGNLPRAGVLVRDPFPLWRPPAPGDKLNKSGVVGNIASVATGPDGTVWVLSRGGRVWRDTSFDASNRLVDATPIMGDVVAQLHPDTGKVLRRWGSGQFYMPHMISVDRNNTVWITDVGRHQALQFTASGQLLRAIGKKLTPGHETDTLCKPTQVAFLNDGSFLIADGYCNSRVLRYTPDGAWHSTYTLPQHGDGVGGMGVAHSLVVDECDAQLSLADREAKVVHRWNLNTFELIESKSLAQYGKVWALAKGPYGRTLALTWQPGRDATLLDVERPGGFAWTLPNSTSLWPHDLALGVAALPLTGAGDRLLSVYVAPLCEGCGPLEKYVLVPRMFGAPPPDTPRPVVVPPGQRPPLAHLGHIGAAGHKEAGGTGAAEAPPADDAAQAEADAEADAEEEKNEAVVEAEEEEEDRQEAEALSDPGVLAELRAQLANLSAQLEARARADAADEYEALRVRRGGAPGAGGGSGGWATLATVVFLSVLAGVGVGGLAAYTLWRNAYEQQRRGYAAPADAAARLHGGGGGGGGGAAPNGDAPGARRGGLQSIDDRLAEDEELEGGDTRRLLASGGAGLPNGVTRR